MIVDLHCGHCIFGRSAFARRDDGASRSATQSRRQDSCAVSAQGHGDRHAEDVGVSSVSSAKHIQHFCGSYSSALDERSKVCSSAFSELEDGGELSSSSVCESMDAVGFEGDTLCCSEGEFISCEES